MCVIQRHRHRHPQLQSQPQQQQAHITDLSPNDVVLGRGAGPNEHPGNIAFREIVLGLKPSYTATVNRKQKSLIAGKVVDAIKARRGRFLKRAPGHEDDVFVLADEEVVMEKSKQALRHTRCTVKPRKGRVSSLNSLTSTGTASTAASTVSFSGASYQAPTVASPESSTRNASMSMATPSPPRAKAPTLPSPASPADTASSTARTKNLLAIALVAQQQQQQQQQQHQNAIVLPPVPSKPVLTAQLSTVLQDTSCYQTVLQLLMATAESKRRQSSTAECLQLLELVETLIAAKRASQNTATVAAPQARSETFISSPLPPLLVAQLMLLSQQQQQQQQKQQIVPAQPTTIPMSYKSSGINDQVLKNANLFGQSPLPKAS